MTCPAESFAFDDRVTVEGVERAFTRPERFTSEQLSGLAREVQDAALGHGVYLYEPFDKERGFEASRLTTATTTLAPGSSQQRRPPGVGR